MTPTLIVNTEPWTERAACRGLWELFDFDPDRGHRTTHYRRAVAICHQRCPVLEQCREYATRAGDVDGVWGGELMRTQGGHEIAHGTRRGYDQHRKRGVSVCDECLTAVREYQARKRAEAAS